MHSFHVIHLFDARRGRETKRGREKDRVREREEEEREKEGMGGKRRKKEIQRDRMKATQAWGR